MASGVNPAIVEAVTKVSQQVIGPSPTISSQTAVARQVANGIAYQAVAQASAAAIQDAASVVSNIGQVTQAAMAVITSNIVKSPPASIAIWAPTIPVVASVAVWSVTHFTSVSAAATAVLAEFPSS